MCRTNCPSTIVVPYSSLIEGGKTVFAITVNGSLKLLVDECPLARAMRIVPATNENLEIASREGYFDRLASWHQPEMTV